MTNFKYITLQYTCKFKVHSLKQRGWNSGKHIIVKICFIQTCLNNQYSIEILSKTIKYIKCYLDHTY